MPRIFQMNMYICKPKQSCSNTSPPTFRETWERSPGPSALLLPSVTLCGARWLGGLGQGRAGPSSRSAPHCPLWYSAE